MIEQFKNGVTTTLNGAINNSVTSLIVTSATGFPTVGSFRIIIESEILIVTAVSGTTFTVTRGTEGSTAASHADTINVTNILTAGALDQFRSDINAAGAIASVPAAVKAGNLYFSNDAPVLIRDNGSALEYYGPLWKFTPPLLSNFVWVNQGAGTTVNSANGGLAIVENTATNGENLRILKKSTSSTPYTITVALLMTSNTNSGAFSAGIVLRESSSSKVMGFCAIRITGNTQVSVYKWTNSTTFSSTAFNDNVGINTGNAIIWLRMTDDGTNRLFYTSADGFNWSLQFSETRTTFMTANECGIFANAPNSGSVANRTSIANFLHYLEN